MVAPSPPLVLFLAYTSHTSFLTLSKPLYNKPAKGQTIKMYYLLLILLLTTTVLVLFLERLWKELTKNTIYTYICISKYKWDRENLFGSQTRISLFPKYIIVMYTVYRSLFLSRTKKWTAFFLASVSPSYLFFIRKDQVVKTIISFSNSGSKIHHY